MTGCMTPGFGMLKTYARRQQTTAFFFDQVLNPKSVSRYDGLRDAGLCHAEDTSQKTTNHWVFL